MKSEFCFKKVFIFFYKKHSELFNTFNRTIHAIIIYARKYLYKNMMSLKS